MTLLLAYIVPLVLRNLCVLAAIMVLVVEEKFHALRQDKEIMSIDQSSREQKMKWLNLLCAVRTFKSVPLVAYLNMCLWMKRRKWWKIRSHQNSRIPNERNEFAIVHHQSQRAGASVDGYFYLLARRQKKIRKKFTFTTVMPKRREKKTLEKHE